MIDDAAAINGFLAEGREINISMVSARQNFIYWVKCREN